MTQKEVIINGETYIVVYNAQGVEIAKYIKPEPIVEPEPTPEVNQLDRIETTLIEVKEGVESQNVYKANYNLLTDNSTQSPTMLRSNIQALFTQANDTQIVNAEPFVDSWVTGTPEAPQEHPLNSVSKYKGQVYKCVQAHTHRGEEGWSPIDFPAGWMIKHTTDIKNPKPFVQPQGSHDAYQKGECVLFTDSNIYVSKVDANVYSPTDYPANWTKYIVE